MYLFLILVLCVSICVCPLLECLCIARIGDTAVSRPDQEWGPGHRTLPDMTRFLLSLDQAVDTVFAALGQAKQGETYVPRTHAATVFSIAKALIVDRKIEINITGIRPGEKMHEIMVSEKEAHHTVKRGDYYAIRPILPELSDKDSTESNALDKEFSSADTVLDYEGTVALLHDHNLLIEQGESILEEEELLR